MTRRITIITPPATEHDVVPGKDSPDRIFIAVLSQVVSRREKIVEAYFSDRPGRTYGGMIVCEPRSREG